MISVETLTFLQPEAIPRSKFSSSGINKHAHMGIGAVVRKTLSPEPSCTRLCKLECGLSVGFLRFVGRGEAQDNAGGL